MLKVQGLVKRYRTGDLALKGVDLLVPEGQVMALIGPSGAGIALQTWEPGQRILQSRGMP